MKRFHFHQWDYNAEAKERTCHKCGKHEYAHMIRNAPKGWDGFTSAQTEWRDYEPSGANRP